MRELIRIQERNGSNVVSARDLYEYLDLGRDFTTWFKKMTGYGFEEGLDFTPVWGESTGGRPSVDYALTLDCAKEIAMIQRTEKGKQARQYFIECEKQLNKPMDFYEMMFMNLNRLKEQEVRVKAIESEVQHIKASIQTRPDYFTVVGFATYKGISINLQIASSIGRKASHECKVRGIPMDKIPDPRFGVVRLYPRDILEEVFVK